MPTEDTLRIPVIQLDSLLGRARDDEEPVFLLSDESTWKTLDDANIFCTIDRNAPPPDDLKELDCYLWTHGPTDVEIHAKGFETYHETLNPDVSERCGGCHFAGNPFSSQVFVDYADTYAARRTMLTQVYGCNMPPPEAPQLTLEERGALLKWFVCDAPQN